MSVINKNAYIDFYNQEYVVFYAEQYDDGTRSITLTPKDGSEMITFSADEWEASIIYCKPDGKVCFDPITLNNDSTFYIELTEQMLAVAGKSVAQLYLVNKADGKVIQSTTFMVMVDDAIARDDIESASEFSSLNELMTEIASAYEKIENIAAKEAQINSIYNTAVKAVEEAATALEDANQAIETAESINSTAAQSADDAAKSASEASGYLASVKSNADNAALSESNAKTSETNASNSASSASTSASNAKTSETNAKASADAASASEANAKTSETNAASSATSASDSATTATTKANEASTSASNALTSAQSASASATTATTKASEASASAKTATEQAELAVSKVNEIATHATNASTSEANAKTYAESAEQSATNASSSATSASASATSAENSAKTATEKAQAISDYADLSESYAIGGTGVRDNEDVDNAKYYYEQAKGISQGLQGILLPMGTITFSQLSSQTKQSGYMYNISDEFTTDDTFKEGAGYSYPAGTNVYCTADGYWDCLAGTVVTGVKGDAETEYRKGYINLTPENLGIGVMTNDDIDKIFGN